MQRLNVWIAVPSTTKKELKKLQDAKSPTLDDPGYIINRAAYEAAIAGVDERVLNTIKRAKDQYWKVATIGGKDYELESIYVTSDIGFGLINATVPDGIILGVWQMNGLQYGTYREGSIDENGDVVTSIAGTPVYPLHEDLTKFFESGVTSQQHLMLGWAGRIF